MNQSQSSHLQNRSPRHGRRRSQSRKLDCGHCQLRTWKGTVAIGWYDRLCCIDHPHRQAQASGRQFCLPRQRHVSTVFVKSRRRRRRHRHASFCDFTRSSARRPRQPGESNCRWSIAQQQYGTAMEGTRRCGLASLRSPAGVGSTLDGRIWAGHRHHQQHHHHRLPDSSGLPHAVEPGRSHTADRTSSQTSATQTGG